MLGLVANPEPLVLEEIAAAVFIPIELRRLAEARFDVLSSRYFGLYMTFLAEAGGKYSVAILKHLKPVLFFLV
jgi:hypothetical protein